MSEISESEFNPGDIVIAKEEEKNIDLIPAGTVIKLTYKVASCIWEGDGKIDGLLQPLWVNEDNLEHVMK